MFAGYQFVTADKSLSFASHHFNRLPYDPFMNMFQQREYKVYESDTD